MCSDSLHVYSLRTWENRTTVKEKEPTVLRLRPYFCELCGFTSRFGSDVVYFCVAR